MLSLEKDGRGGYSDYDITRVTDTPPLPSSLLPIPAISPSPSTHTYIPTLQNSTSPPSAVPSTTPPSDFPTSSPPPNPIPPTDNCPITTPPDHTTLATSPATSSALPPPTPPPRRSSRATRLPTALQGFHIDAALPSRPDQSNSSEVVISPGESCLYTLGTRSHAPASMYSSSGTSSNSLSGKNVSGLEALQKQHEERTRKVEELKSQIDSVRLDLEKKRRDALEDKKEVFKSLSDKYNSLREEYNALSERSSE
ncbi:hypothetical protein DKX38_024756 [Salix brachista]|uniref:Uncharacterized protein n=1 Tax=Salix brachista TaxID=2182728 RepID=A0A5N5JZZ3_9ROSI|nr:hypothetical protein DKX38_024756 [Salix brachista]